MKDGLKWEHVFNIGKRSGPLFMLIKKIIKLLMHPIQVLSNRIPKKPLPPLQIRIWNDLLGSLEKVMTIGNINSQNNEKSIYVSEIDLNSQFIDLELQQLFVLNGTDKDRNGYSPLYSNLLQPLKDKPAVLVEVGIGTNNTKLPSNMGATGIPGASLRAFSEYLGRQAICVGIDIDSSILFQTETIKTMFVNQLEPTTFCEIKRFLNDSNGADLIIDDGLHRPISCINTLNSLLEHLRIGGFYVIEDQDPTLEDYWNFVCLRLNSKFTYKILYTQEDIIVIVISRLY
jgi:hypothetical protein